MNPWQIAHMVIRLPCLRSFPAAVLLLAPAGHAGAQSQRLTNANFEIPSGLAAGAEDSAAGHSVPGWVEYEPSGYPWEWDEYDPLSAEGGAESGKNVLKGLAYNPATAYVEQVLTNALQNGTRYTLAGWVADPDGHTPENGAQFLLFAGTNLLTTVIDTPSAAKAWNQASRPYDSGIDNPYAGLPLKVRIMHNPGNSYRVLIDNLSLTAVNVSNAALPALAFTNVQDYGFMFWSNGPASYHYGIKTSRYGMVFNWVSVTPTTLFPIPNPSPESAVLTESWAASFPTDSPPVSLSSQVVANGATNNVGTLVANTALIECGKYFQRRWQKVQAGGLPLDTNQSGLEMAAWPDRLSFVLRLAPSNTISSATLQLKLTLTNLYNKVLAFGAGGALEASNGTGFVFLPSTGSSAISFNPTNATVMVMTALNNWQTNQQGSVGLVIYPVAAKVAWALTNAVDTEAAPLPLAVTPILPSGGGLAVNYDADRGWYDVSLPASGTVGDNGILRAQVAVTNNTPTLRLMRINFDGVPFYIPGITAVLRDSSQNPVGIPVQLSKDWDTPTTYPVLPRNWFHGLAMLTVPTNTNVNLELTMAGENWGGVPAATHSQLCVYGYGTGCQNQQWDESALGKFGESLTYDVEHVLTDNDGADSRPILLLNPNGQRGQWCINLGGAEFLRYYDSGGIERQHRRMRTQYARYGPNLTQVTYAGQTDDGTMVLSYKASLGRSDDYTRGWHQLTVNVNSNLSFSRLVFFQMPGDTYAYDNGTNLAFGYINQTNAVRQWIAAPSGQNANIGTAAALTNNQPWVSIHGYNGTDSGYSPGVKGYIIRSWKARINGVDNVPPFFVEHSLASGYTGSSMDIVPPPGVTTLQAGDYVQAIIERIYVPSRPGEYYGPDINMATAATNYANTYYMVLREAIGNNLSLNLQAGTLLQIYPTIEIGLTNDFAQFSVTGGLNYAPVTFNGASTYESPVVQQLVGTNWVTVNQAVNGNDFWQTDYNSSNQNWDITFNLQLGGTNYQDVPSLLTNASTSTFRFSNPNSFVPLTTGLGLSASPSSPSVYGQTVVFTAKVQTNGATAAGATGNVLFSTEGADFATNALVNGAALYTNSVLDAGGNSIQAVYSGDNHYLPRTNNLTQVVNQANTTVSYFGTNFIYTGTCHGPGIVISGSSGTCTTNYVGNFGMTYLGANAPTNIGSYYVTNAVAPDSNYLGTNTSFTFTITAAPPIVFTNAVWLAANGSFQLGGTGPVGQPWRLFATTNLTLPLAQWALENSNSFSGNGQFNYTSPISPYVMQQFYLMVSS